MPNHSKPEHQARVLVVDDDSMVRVLTRAALKKLSLEVEEAGNGEEALELFMRGGFSLVLLDVEMPIMDGFTACSKIRALPQGDGVSIVIITAMDDLASIRRAFELGATDFITKPINWPMLTHRMRYLLRARNAFDQLRESQVRLSEAQRIARLGHWDWDIKTGDSLWSEETFRILGREPGEITPTYSAFLEAVHPEDRRTVSRAVCDALEGSNAFGLEHRVRLPDGSERNVFSQGRLLTGVDTEFKQLRCIVQDVTERKQAEERIYQLSYYDELTGLPNREMFMELAERMLSASRRDGSDAAILFLDIDRFKRFNDSLGHPVGDKLLQTVATRLDHSVRSSDIVAKTGFQDDFPYSLARPGGDEFLILLRGLHGPDSIANFVQRILQELALPIITDAGEIFISASVGISLFPADSVAANELVMHADTALVHAKSDGGNCFRFFAKGMNDRAVERLSLESRLNRAIDNQELQLYYQPQVNLVTGKLEGLEALLRWITPGQRSVSPAEFIPIAEESGLIGEIGKWVIEAACAQIALWCAGGYTLVPVAVNLSARQFTQPDLVETISTALTASDIAPKYLELELTERILMADVIDIRAKLFALKGIGLRLSVDDFGTGYSSLAYLKQFPLDTLKIDRSFIKDLGMDQSSEAIVSSIVALCKGLKLGAIAEGVETAAQREILRNLGCTIIQGYLMSRPVPAEDVVRFFVPAGTGQLGERSACQHEN